MIKEKIEIIIKFNILSTLNFFIPKKANKVAFLSHPDFADNSKAFYEFISKNTDLKCIWFVSDKKMYKILKDKGINTFMKNDLKGLFEFAKCKYVVSSNFENLSLKSKNQIHIALSHGMPLKKIGFLLDGYSLSNKKALKKIDYTIATSPFFQDVICRAFNLEKEKVLVSGQPRNDYLFNSNKIEDLNTLLNVDIDNYEKVIVYTPTFRKHSLRNDGELSMNNIINLNQYNEDELNKYLSDNNYLLITKLHREEKTFINSKEYSNIKMLDSDELTYSKITLNEILNICDLLITDYSSVYFDYLLLDKPLLFINTDEQQYSNTRGFIIDDLDLYRPGPKVSTLNELSKECSLLLNNSNYFKKERDYINSICNSYIDDQSCKRIFDIIFKK